MSMVEIIAFALLKYGPEMARSLIAIFQKQEVTPADWESVFALARTPYQWYINPPAPPSTQPTTPV